MSRKEEFYFDSSAGTTKIHAVAYVPDGEIKAVLQITHGMGEFIDRYDEFGFCMAERGFAVAGHDHLGHGGSINSRDDYGFFAEKDGNIFALKDIHSLTLLLKEKYPDVPLFLIGHSMGSFYTRNYLCSFGDDLSGAIVMATAHPSRFHIVSCKIMTKMLMAIKGKRYRSKFISRIMFGDCNARFQPSRTDADFLCKDEKKVDEYLNDERCQFTFTLSGDYDVFTVMGRFFDGKLLSKMPKELPVLFLSGEDDPVGDFGEGVKRAYRSFIDAGMKNVTLKLYPGDRHEPFNETDRYDVFGFVNSWIDDICKEPGQ